MHRRHRRCRVPAPQPPPGSSLPDPGWAGLGTRTAAAEVQVGPAAAPTTQMLDETLVKTLAKTRMATQTAVQTLGATGAADCCQAVAATVAAAAEPAVGVHRARGLRRRRRRPLSSHPLLYCGPQVCYQGVPCTPPAVRGSRLFDHVHSPPTTLTHSLLHLFCSLPRPCSPPPPRFVTCSLPPARHSTPTVHSQPPCSPRPVPGSSPRPSRRLHHMHPPAPLALYTHVGRAQGDELSLPPLTPHAHA